MNRKEPLFRVVKRESSSPVRQALAYVAAVVIALLIGAALLSSMDVDPLTFYQKMVTMGIPGNKFPWRIVENFVKLFVPLLITSLALSLAFRMRFWNIGGEGQFIMGAICAAAAAHKLGPVLPQPLVVLVMALCGILGGGLYGLIVALLKVRYNTNETLLTLMLNYIALHLVSYLQAGPWRDPEANGFSKIARFDKNAGLDKVLGVHFGWIIMLVLVALVWIYLKRSKQGYEISVVGESQDTARYAGIHVKKVVLRTMFLSGAIAGIAGVCQAAGSDMTLSMGVAGGVGFTAIIVAWLCQLNPGMILVVSLLFSILEKGSSVVQSTYGLSSDCADVLQGIILFFILGSEFFVRYAFVGRGKKGGAK